jgi:hypothetical protein
MPQPVRVLNQFRQIRVERGLAAGEDEVRHALRVQGIDDLFPVGRGQRGHVEAVGFVVAVVAGVVAAVGDG